MEPAEKNIIGEKTIQGDTEKLSQKYKTLDTG